MVNSSFIHVPISSIDNVAMFDPCDLIPSVPSWFEPLSSLPDDPPCGTISTTPHSSPSPPRSIPPKRLDHHRSRPILKKTTRRTTIGQHPHADLICASTVHTPAVVSLLCPEDTKLFALPSPASGHFLFAAKLLIQGELIDALTMIDSGATGSFISLNFAKRAKIPLTIKTVPIPITTIDGSPVHTGPITSHLVSSLSLSVYTRKGSSLKLHLSATMTLCLGCLGCAATTPSLTGQQVS